MKFNLFCDSVHRFRRNFPTLSIYVHTSFQKQKFSLPKSFRFLFAAVISPLHSPINLVNNLILKSQEIEQILRYVDDLHVKSNL